MDTKNTTAVRTAATDSLGSDDWRSRPTPPPPAPGSVPVSAAMKLDMTHLPLIGAVSGLVALAATSLMPWFQYSTFLGSGSEYAFIDGAAVTKLTLSMLCIGVAAVVGALWKKVGQVILALPILAGLGMAFLAFVAMAIVLAEGDGGFGSGVSVGVGAPLTFVCGLLSAGAGLWGLVENFRANR